MFCAPACLCVCVSTHSTASVRSIYSGCRVRTLSPMASASVATTKSSYLNQKANRVTSMASPPPRRISSQSPSANLPDVGSRVGFSSRSPSRQSGVSMYRRCLLFLLNPETNPQFPFCETAYESRSRVRWPPWPHRLDSGHSKV